MASTERKVKSSSARHTLMTFFSKKFLPDNNFANQYSPLWVNKKSYLYFLLNEVNQEIWVNKK